MLELSTLGTSVASVSLHIPREAGQSPPFALMVKLFDCSCWYFHSEVGCTWSGGSSSLPFTPMWLWLCREMVFNTFHDCRVGLWMRLGVGFTLRTRLPKTTFIPGVTEKTLFSLAF